MGNSCPCCQRSSEHVRWDSFQPAVSDRPLSLQIIWKPAVLETILGNEWHRSWVAYYGSYNRGRYLLLWHRECHPTMWAKEQQETQSLKSNTYTLHNVCKIKLYYHDLSHRRWSLFSHHHWIEPMKYSSLNNMLLKIHEKWKTGELSQREVKPLCKFS